MVEAIIMMLDLIIPLEKKSLIISLQQKLKTKIMKQLRNLLTSEAQATNDRTSDLELQNDSALLVLICETKTDPELAKWVSDNALIVYRCLSVQGRLNYCEIIKNKLKNK